MVIPAGMPPGMVGKPFGMAAICAATVFADCAMFSHKARSVVFVWPAIEAKDMGRSLFSRLPDFPVASAAAKPLWSAAAGIPAMLPFCASTAAASIKSVMVRTPEYGREDRKRLSRPPWLRSN